MSRNFSNRDALIHHLPPNGHIMGVDAVITGDITPIWPRCPSLARARMSWRHSSGQHGAGLRSGGVGDTQRQSVSRRNRPPDCHLPRNSSPYPPVKRVQAFPGTKSCRQEAVDKPAATTEARPAMETRQLVAHDHFGESHHPGCHPAGTGSRGQRRKHLHTVFASHLICLRMGACLKHLTSSSKSRANRA